MDNIKQQLIGIDLGGTNVRAGLIENGKVLKHAKASVPRSESNPAPVLRCIINTVKEVYSENVVGIGLGLPGTMDKENGIINSIVNIPSFTDFPIAKLLQDEFGVPVSIDNDVNCFILGEKFYGAGIAFRNVVGLSIGTGLGTGIINANRLLEDANGGSGELGEISYLDGKLEHYCSGHYFKQALGIDGGKAYELASSGDVEALNAFRQLGMHLGKAVHLILFAYDPQAIIIGGSVAQSKAFFHEAMMEEVNRFPFKDSLKKLTIAYAGEPLSPVLGAGLLVK